MSANVPRPQQQLVVGAADVPIDPYDAIDLLSVRDDEPSQLLAWAARRVADWWNDPPYLHERMDVERVAPELAALLYDLLGGGPGGTTEYDVRPMDGAS